MSDPSDLHPGRAPVVRATGADVTYELRLSSGLLALRCDDAGEIFARLDTTLITRARP